MPDGNGTAGADEADRAPDESAPPTTEVTVRLAPEDIEALATAIAGKRARLAREDIAALAAAFAKALHEKARSPNFQFDVLHRLPYSHDSATYVAEHMPEAMKVPGKENHLRFALARVGEGLVLEFGVFKGQSVNAIAAILPERTVHGFDSFEGLPEAWPGYNVEAAHFDQGGRLPDVAANVELHKGWFDDSLPQFLADHPGPVAFIHVDCDLYSSTKIVLDALAGRVRPGTVIVFDEYHNFPYWREHEHRAFMEFCAEHDVEYDYISFNNLQAAVRISAIAGAGG
jgi:predicted O-methyltransferase YrrM